ncbi:MAG: hypothetical protein AAF266_13310 [Planctomycetota bacterium]
MLSTWTCVSVLAALTAGADAPSVWHADYGKALAETKQDHQPLLVVLEEPADESKSLDAELLTAESGAFPLDSYALCRIDVTTEYGKKVAEGFKVTEFPHVAIIDNSGSVILQRVSGEVTKDQWKSVLARHADGNRAGATRYTVAKPIVADSTTATVVSEPAAPVYTPSISAPVSYPSARPYCPSCQLRNR